MWMVNKQPRSCDIIRSWHGPLPIAGFLVVVTKQSWPVGSAHSNSWLRFAVHWEAGKHHEFVIFRAIPMVVQMWPTSSITTVEIAICGPHDDSYMEALSLSNVSSAFYPRVSPIRMSVKAKEAPQRYVGKLRGRTIRKPTAVVAWCPNNQRLGFGRNPETGIFTPIYGSGSTGFSLWNSFMRKYSLSGMSCNLPVDAAKRRFSIPNTPQRNKFSEFLG